MGAMTVAHEFLLPVPVQRFVYFAAARERQRHVTSQRNAVPSDFATVPVVGIDAECKYELDIKTCKSYVV